MTEAASLSVTVSAKAPPADVGSGAQTLAPKIDVVRCGAPMQPLGDLAGQDWHGLGCWPDEPGESGCGIRLDVAAPTSTRPPQLR